MENLPININIGEQDKKNIVDAVALGIETQATQTLAQKSPQTFKESLENAKKLIERNPDEWTLATVEEIQQKPEQKILVTFKTLQNTTVQKSLQKGDTPLKKGESVVLHYFQEPFQEKFGKIKDIITTQDDWERLIGSETLRAFTEVLQEKNALSTTTQKIQDQTSDIVNPL